MRDSQSCSDAHEKNPGDKERLKKRQRTLTSKVLEQREEDEGQTAAVSSTKERAGAGLTVWGLLLPGGLRAGGCGVPKQPAASPRPILTLQVQGLLFVA